MPENTKYVGRPTKWGNPYLVDFGNDLKNVLDQYKIHIQNKIDSGLLDLNELIGYDLACWCNINKPCHVDILIDLIKDHTESR